MNLVDEPKGRNGSLSDVQNALGDCSHQRWQFGQQLLTLGLTVIVEWGTWGKSERDTLRLRARELGATVELHHLSASVDALLNRVQRRSMENPPKTEQLRHWADIFQAPTAEEAALFDNTVTIEL